MVDDRGLARRQAHHCAVLGDDGVGDADRPGEAAVLGEVHRLAVGGDDAGRAQPFVHQPHLAPARVSRDVDEAVGIGHHLDPALGETVHDGAHRLFVARDQARGEHHLVALGEGQHRVLVLGDARERRPRFSL